MSRIVAAVAASACLSGAAAAGQAYVMMPDSTNARVVLFNPFDGSLVNSNYFGFTSGGTSVHALQVGQEIWISQQLGDRIDRFDLFGTAMGTITGGMDNIRGMQLVGDKVYVTNGGTANGAPGSSTVLTFDTSGTNTGFFNTAGLAPSPFHVLGHQGGLLVSSSSGNNDVHYFDLSGGSIGPFHNSTSLNFGEQMDHDVTGNVLVAGFSTNNVVTLNANTGALISSFAASGARGVYQLGNGNVMWTNGSGAWVFDVGSGTSSLVYAGGGRFLDDLVIPAPGSAALVGLAGLAGVRRRRA